MGHAAITRLRRPSAGEIAGAVMSAFFLVPYVAAALAVGLSSGRLRSRTATVIVAALFAVATAPRASGALNARSVGL
jgi:hypothetical protein